MSSERRVSPRMTEDLPFREVHSPPHYAHTTDKPIRYVTVVDPQDMVLGYVWVNDEDDAAGWTVRPAGGDEAFNRGSLWVSKLNEAKLRGITPTEALDEMIHDSPPKSSHIVPDSLTEAPSLAALKELAARS